MSDAIKKLHDYLAMSPSVVYPEDVLEFLPAIKAENAKLQELVQYICDENYGDDWFAEKAAELGIEARY